LPALVGTVFNPVRLSRPEVFHQRAARWAVSAYDREELPARAFYAADAEKRDPLDRALFEAAWVEGSTSTSPKRSGGRRSAPASTRTI
jgi:hypothetical protein